MLVTLQTPASLDLAGGGYRDSTRIAASNPDLWRDILIDNRDQLVPLIEKLAANLEALRAAVAAGDAARIEAILSEGKSGRDRIIPS